MGFLGNIDWLSFAGGIVFVMFILPFIMNFVGKLKGRRTSAA